MALHGSAFLGQNGVCSQAGASEDSASQRGDRGSPFCYRTACESRPRALRRGKPPQLCPPSTSPWGRGRGCSPPPRLLRASSGRGSGVPLTSRPHYPEAPVPLGPSLCRALECLSSRSLLQLWRKELEGTGSGGEEAMRGTGKEASSCALAPGPAEETDHSELSHTRPPGPAHTRGGTRARGSEDFQGGKEGWKSLSENQVHPARSTPRARVAPGLQLGQADGPGRWPLALSQGTAEVRGPERQFPQGAERWGPVEAAWLVSHGPAVLDAALGGDA